jgi:DNA-binding MarR family transcriptional regulator
VEAGLIERHHDKVDGRVVLVQLTSDGKRIRRRMAATHTRDIRRLVGAPLDSSAHQALDGALKRLTSPLEHLTSA